VHPVDVTRLVFVFVACCPLAWQIDRSAGLRMQGRQCRQQEAPVR